MGDVTDIADSKKTRGKAGSGLAAALKKVEAARTAAVEAQCDIELAASIVEIIGMDAGEARSPRNEGESDEPWLRVEYMGRQLRRHVQDLSRELDEVEAGLWAVKRATEPPPPDEVPA